MGSRLSANPYAYMLCDTGLEIAMQGKVNNSCLDKRYPCVTYCMCCLFAKFS